MMVLANLLSAINTCSHPELSLFARTKGSQKINSVQGKLICADLLPQFTERTQKDFRIEKSKKTDPSISAQLHVLSVFRLRALLSWQLRYQNPAKSPQPGNLLHFRTYAGHNHDSSVARVITQAYVLKLRNALSLTLQQKQCCFYFCICTIQDRKWTKTGPKLTHQFLHTSFYRATMGVWQVGTASDSPTGSHFHLPRPWPKQVQFSMCPSSWRLWKVWFTS